jgi:hypothetical protein
MSVRWRAIVVFLYLLIFEPGLHVAAAEMNEYIGADRCKSCHEREYAGWRETGHARILQTIQQVDPWSVPLPAGMERDQISYVVGGYRWKTLFLDRSGHLITTTGLGPGENQYNVQSKQWVDSAPGEKVVYDCGRCHTTGYSPRGHQNGLEGIQGRWKFEGVQCEACHGPGKEHTRTTLKRDLRGGIECRTCHGTPPYDRIPMKGVFFAPYTEANQLLNSPKRNFRCVECHNPHLPAERSITQKCTQCHEAIAQEYRGSLMHRAGVTCEDCHMPPAEVIPHENPATFEGDFKSHLFRIGHMQDFPAGIEGGLRVTPGYLSVDYACMRCHQVYEDRRWAIRYSLYVHNLKVTTNVKIM